MLRVHPQETLLLSDLTYGDFNFFTEAYRRTVAEFSYQRDALTPSSYGPKLQRHFKTDIR